MVPLNTEYFSKQLSMGDYKPFDKLFGGMYCLVSNSVEDNTMVDYTDKEPSRAMLKLQYLAVLLRN